LAAALVPSEEHDIRSLSAPSAPPAWVPWPDGYVSEYEGVGVGVPLMVGVGVELIVGVGVALVLGAALVFGLGEQVGVAAGGM
jgi:hypothetical protein